MKIPATQTHHVDVDVNPQDIIDASVKLYIQKYPKPFTHINKEGRWMKYEYTCKHTGDIEYKTEREATEEEKWREKFLNELINCVNGK